MDDASVLLLLEEMRKFSDHICDRIDALGNRLKRIEEFDAKSEKQLTSPSAPTPSLSPTSTTTTSQAAAASAAAPCEAVFTSSGSEYNAAFGSATTGTPLHHPPARCSTPGLTHGESTLVHVSTAPAPPSTSPAAPLASALCVCISFGDRNTVHRASLILDALERICACLDFDGCGELLRACLGLGVRHELLRASHGFVYLDVLLRARHGADDPVVPLRVRLGSTNRDMLLRARHGRSFCKCCRASVSVAGGMTGSPSLFSPHR
jgi:hypothetical protein